MNDNLPDIDFKEKKEKKRGALGWLRSKLGIGSRGAMGEAGITPSAMNVGKAAFGAGKFGASSGGLAGLLAGKAGVIATIAMMAVAGGLYVSNNSSAPSVGTAAFSSNVSSDKYVPAILRSQAANNGSSLDMFKDTNKGALAMEAPPAEKAKPKDGGAAAAAEGEAQAQDPNAPATEDNTAQDMMAKLQGGNMASLTSQLGGGSNKMSNMGGFGNKFGQGANGAKTGFTNGIGTGFSAMPKFDSRKKKMLAMKGAARPVFGGAKAGKKGNIGAGAFGQAKGMRDIQKSFTGTSIDGARSTQDKAWEGSTGEGDASGGAGLNDAGGAGIVSGPSLDNAGSGGGGGGTGTAQEPIVPDASGPSDISPWASTVSNIMMLIMLSAVLSAVASKLCASKVPWVYWLGVFLAAIAAIAAVAAIVMSIGLMKDQALMGSLYLIGGGLAAAAAIAALLGAAESALAPGAETVMILAAGAGVVTLIGSMLGGK